MALSSGPPPSAVAIVRASGPAVPALAEAFGVAPLPPRRAVLRRVVSPRDGSLLDRALALHFPAPATATGEDVLEFHLHGSPALVERVLGDALLVSGVRAAEPGEFTWRAVLNGRIGLPDAEALADLLEARTEGERRRATRLADGALGALLAGWRADALRALALVEAHLDFSDEGDVAGDATDEGALLALADHVDRVLHDSRDADKLTDGVHVALIGPPNAGKSSLMNALAGRDAALVSPEAGTTRDVVSVSLEITGYRVSLHDTAGIRDGAGGIEALGVKRSRAILARADMVLHVASPDTEPLPETRPGLRIGHKADLAPPGWGAGRHLTSVHDPSSIERLRAALEPPVRAALGGAEAALVTRARQRSHLTAFAAALRDAAATPALEVKAEHLRRAMDAIGRLTGEVGVEDILGEVFGRFCIGK